MARVQKALNCPPQAPPNEVLHTLSEQQGNNRPPTWSLVRVIFLPFPLYIFCKQSYSMYTVLQTVNFGFLYECNDGATTSQKSWLCYFGCRRIFGTYFHFMFYVLYVCAWHRGVCFFIALSSCEIINIAQCTRISSCAHLKSLPCQYRLGLYK